MVNRDPEYIKILKALDCHGMNNMSMYRHMEENEAKEAKFAGGKGTYSLWNDSGCYECSGYTLAFTGNNLECLDFITSNHAYYNPQSYIVTKESSLEELYE